MTFPDLPVSDSPVSDSPSATPPVTALPIIGWRERVALPDLNITSVKAKIDTGARSSALQAFDIEVFKKENTDFVRFKVHPSQSSRKKTVNAEAPLLEMRSVRSSSGQSETRPVIQTTVSTGDYQWPIELTLTNRDVMGFRMLLGRQAVRQRFLVDSGQSYLQSSLPIQKLKGPSPKLKARIKGRKTKSSAPKNIRQQLKHEDSNFIQKFLSIFDPPS